MDLNDTPRAGRVPRAGPRLARGAPPTRRPPQSGARGRQHSTPGAPGRRKLAEGGLAGVTWPKEYGGQGLGPIEQVIVNQEIGRAGVPGHPRRHRRRHARPDDHRPRHRRAEDALPRPDAPRRRGLVPALLRAGRRLGPRGDPDARARAQDDGSWRLSGQKVWTTNAQFASYGLLLARTEPRRAQAQGPDDVHRPDGRRGRDGPRRCARSPARPSSTRCSSTTSSSPPTACAGRSTAAGATALTTLMFERVTIGLGSRGPRLPRGPLRAAALADDAAAAADPRRAPAPGRDRAPSSWRIRFTGYRTLTALQRGQIPGPEAGLAKITTVNAAIAAGDLIADVARPRRPGRGQRVGAT